MAFMRRLWNGQLPQRTRLSKSQGNLPALVLLILLSAQPANLFGADVVQGDIAIGLKNSFNTFATGIQEVSVPIDAVAGADGDLYVASIAGQVIAASGNEQSLFLDLNDSPAVAFTSAFAGGLMGIAFHPDYDAVGSPGYHKFYTYSSDLKTVNQNGSSNVSPGNELTGLPDFYHPEMYAPAVAGNPLTNWSNPNSPDSGNSDFDHFNIIREWTATSDGAVIDMSVAPREILRMAHGFAGKGSHNGGGFRFGPDGYLYLATGDGGGNAGKDYDGSGINNSEDGHTDGIGNAQDRTVIYGKVLRIDPTAELKNSANGQYGIPLDNPYVLDDSAPEYLDEIYAIGFRNPWKLSFDDTPGGDGSLYLANVGQHHREEIEQILAGGNYGWGYLEGNVRLVHEGSATGEPNPRDPIDGTDGTVVRTPPGGFAAFEAQATPPLVDYLTRRQTVNGQLVGEGTAVTGGYVYRGELIPELDGMYVFGDYSIAGSPPPGVTADKGRLFYLDPSSPTAISEFKISFGEEAVGRLLGFGRDRDGEIHALFDNGNVTQLVGSPDRDQDGIVDGLDFLSIQRETLGLIPFWQTYFGSSLVAAAESQAVPEPNTAAMILLALNLCLAGRDCCNGKTLRRAPDSTSFDR